jgi:hydroxyacylglutathione hydrolase
MIQVKTFYAHNDLRNYSYLVFDDQTGSAWSIDPWDADPFTDYIKKNSLNLKGILNTHSHFDHVRGNAGLRETFGAPVMQLTGGEQIALDQQHQIEVMDTPGHTLDHQVFIWRQQQRPLALFSGDTLFNAGVGNCRNGGEVGLLFSTTQKLLQQLPPETLLYPGHDYRQRNLEFARSVEPDNTAVNRLLKELRSETTFELPPTTLGEETSVNPFLRLDSQQIQSTIGLQRPREIFISLRNLRDRW